MRYDKHHFLYSLLPLFFWGIFMLLNVPCKAQYNNCTNNEGVHPIFTSWGLPDTVCAGSVTPFSIGYDTNNTIVLTPSAPAEPTITKPDTMFIPDGVSCGPNNSCVYSDTITVDGYNGTITSANDIKYVRLNIEHSRTAELNIKLKCPNGNTTVNILYPGNSGVSVSNDCFQASDFPNRWRSYGDYVTTASTIKMGSPVSGSASNSCDPNAMGNGPGTGWNYCWSNNDNSGYSFAIGDGIIYREICEWDDDEEDCINLYNNVVTNNTFDSTHISSSSQFYHPDESFQLFEDCPINGQWIIEIIDITKNNGNNGYLFDWEIVFDESLIAGGGSGGSGSGAIDSAVVLNGGVIDDQLFEQDASDTVFTFTAPINITENTTIERTLRLFNPEAGCYYDTVFNIVVRALETSVHYDTICAGESIMLNAEYHTAESILFNEGFGGITNGNDHGYSGSSTPYNNTLLNFPSHTDNVYQAGGHLRFGKTDENGSITSSAINLSSPYSIKLWLRGWNHASENPHFYLKVDGTTVLSQDHPGLRPPVGGFAYFSSRVGRASCMLVIPVD